MISGSPTPNLPLPRRLADDARTCLLIVGDSIAAGATVIDGSRVIERVACSFADHLARRIGRLRVVVDAVPWRRTPELAEAAPALLATHQPDLMLVVSGANDADIEWKRWVVSKGRVVRSRTRLADFGAALASLARACAGHGTAMICSELISPPLRLRAPQLSAAAGRDLWPLMQQCGGQAACDQVVESYRGAAADEAHRHGFLIAKTGSALEAATPELVYAPDGVHPNDEGHRIMAAVLVAMLEPCLARV